MDKELAFSSAKKLAARLKRGSIGCLELLDFYLGRVERYNPALNAIIAMDIDGARKRAKAADRALRRGEVWGPLHGVPVTIKESFDVAGMATTWGVSQHQYNIAAKNALAVERLNTAGAVLFGKTNVPVMLGDWQTFNPIYGTTNNPWDVSRTPGGSSGGAAAALAAGLTGLEIGSDIGASIRNPAHYCGVYGHKPTFEVCSAVGQNLPGALTNKDLNVIGPMARHAEDLALALDVIAGPSETDGRAWQLKLPKPNKTRLREFRVGLLLTAGTAEADESIQAVLRKLAEFLVRSGAKVSNNAVPKIDLATAHRVFIQLLRAATSGSLSDEVFARAQTAARNSALDNDDYYQWMVIAQAMPHRDWHAWNEQRHQMAAAWEEYFTEYDLLLCPAAATTAFPHNQKGERWERMITVNGKPQPTTAQMFWAGYSGMAYLPSTVAPIGLAEDGLPVGVQIIGPRYGDHTCIAFAQLLEKEYYPFTAPAGFT
ncbi:MAG: amidase [Burkholderiales bacterium]